MHRILAAVALLSVLAVEAPLSAAGAPHHAPPKDACSPLPSRWQRLQCENFHRSAPGDEYFGRMKMSYLGIDNTAHDVAIEAGAYTTNPGLIARLEFADEALRQWAQRYPGDPQLARSYFLMVEVYRKVYTQDAQRRAWAYMQHIIHTYPSSYFAKVLRVDVARGFTEHWFALAQMCPTPLPTPGPRDRRPPPTPTPEPTPVETPTPTPPGQPKVVVITPPCVQPQTPAPEESASPVPEESEPPVPEESATPVPEESATPAPEVTPL
ncbi:MAG TPA: hypothetical protein VMV82_03860 [Candidatus Dormibacteraeota bacterium]|nr:hypothetical protein [Candidatus Dormibacteraeota bacterium]